MENIGARERKRATAAERRADGERERERRYREEGNREWLRPSADVPRIMPTELHGWQGESRQRVLVAVATLVDRRG